MRAGRLCLMGMLTAGLFFSALPAGAAAAAAEAKSDKAADKKPAAPREKPKRRPKRNAMFTIPDVPRDKVICFALYTVHKGTLKLTAQLYPLKEGEDRTVRLEIKDGDRWREVARTKVIEQGWTAPLRVEKWDSARTVPYRVRHGERATYEGTIRRNPVDKDVIVMAAFTGNSVHAAHGGDIPRDDIVANVKKIDADLLFFSGDQVYDHRRHYAMWLKFGRDFGEIIKDRPTITIPDDHDVGQANLWGEEGKKASTGAGPDGGYFMPVEYVKEVERAQTSHLPDPVDPRPIKRGIGVYFTELNWGGISFAILEDRKFKSGPQGKVNTWKGRPDHVPGGDFDPRRVDKPGLKLLGERQLKFLEDWGQDWLGAKLKVALSQTIFCGGAHIHGKVGGRLAADLDSNGWPQTGRDKAIDAMRKCFAVHIAGDQHLGTVFHHGIKEFRDGNVSFCVPSIANLYLRWWDPLSPGKNRKPGDPPYLGDHHDGLDNKVTCLAVANPAKKPNGGDKLTTRAAGFGVIKFNKENRKITFECWPRHVDITDPKARQYKHWPITIDQTDNYGRQAAAWLPTLKVTGMADPVVQVIDQASGAVVYTRRIKGSTFDAKVFKPGKYTVKVGELKTDRVTTIKDIESIENRGGKSIDVKLAGGS